MGRLCVSKPALMLDYTNTDTKAQIESTIR
jgi:hypothetical protein